MPAKPTGSARGQVPAVEGGSSVDNAEIHTRLIEAMQRASLSDPGRACRSAS